MVLEQSDRSLRSLLLAKQAHCAWGTRAYDSLEV
jgi:hypothetical protein